MLTAASALADVSSSIGIVSDYRFRGVSLSDGQPALQAGITYDHRSGFYVGAFASTVELAPPRTGLGAQLYLGYARALSDNLSGELGLIRYAFSEAATQVSPDYTEAFGGLATNAFDVRLYLSPNYFGSGAKSIYLEVNTTRELTPRISFAAHLGLLYTTGASVYSTEYDNIRQADARLGLATTFYGFTLELSAVGVTPRDAECPGHRCAPAIVFAIQRRF